MTFKLTAENEALVDPLVARYPERQAACIPLLHLCQKQNGWVSPEVIDYVAARLRMSSSEVKGVVTFYTMFNQRPTGKHTIWVCRTLSCELMGAKTIQEHLEHKLACHVNETTADGVFTLKKAECLAACGYGPMVQIDDRFYENLTIEKLDALLEQIAKNASSGAGELPPQEETAWPNNPSLPKGPATNGPAPVSVPGPSKVMGQ